MTEDAATLHCPCGNLMISHVILHFINANFTSVEDTCSQCS